MCVERPIPRTTITVNESETPERWTRRVSTVQALAQGARAIVGCAAGKSETRVAHELRTNQTAGKWRTRVPTKRLDGLLGEPWPSAPRTENGSYDIYALHARICAACESHELASSANAA